MNRSEAAALAADTLRILDEGAYDLDAHRVNLRDAVDRAVAHTENWPPERPIPPASPRSTSLHITVSPLGTLQSARQLRGEGYRPAALNFASAKNPGGGFRTGARAQEEYLACRSALYPCIANSPMYTAHRKRSDPFYSAWIIYSPEVPVFREEDGALLPEPWTCALLTCPAVNAGVVLQRRPQAAPEIRHAMTERIHRVLAVAAHYGHDALVLGAWGCGVFKNNPGLIAQLFEDALRGPFAQAFERVDFAVLDTSHEQRFIGPFRRVFEEPPAARGKLPLDPIF